MNPIKNYITRAMVAIAAIAIVVGCGGDDNNNKRPSAQELRLNVEVSDITTITAKIKVTHEDDTAKTWLGFVAENISSASLQQLVTEHIAAGIDPSELHQTRQYVTILEDLKPDTSYKYVAVGCTAEGKTYGDIVAVEFKTLKASDGETDEYNGMRENEAWRVIYVGKDKIDGEIFKHVVRVISTDNNSYAITLVYAEHYDPYQMRDLADAMAIDLKEYLKEYNRENGTSFKFADMLYTGNSADPFDLEPGLYRALAVGFTPSGEVSGLFAVSDEFEVEEQMASPAYKAWLGKWSIEGQNGVVSDVEITKCYANTSFYMTGWEGFDDLAIEVEYDAELDAMFFYSQLVAEDYDLGADYGVADIYLFAGDEDGYFYDNKDGDYYIAIAGILDDGKRAIVRYGVNVPGYPKFTQMFFMADIDGKFYALTPEDAIPSFIASML